MEQDHLIEIITPAYNAEPYIDEFFQSLLEQDLRNWRILARDDGSTDGTLKKLNAWAERLGPKMRLIPNSEKVNLGARGSFSYLFTLTSAHWVACGDADDIWLPNRLSATYNAAMALEAEFGNQMPIVVATDARIVDQSLNEVCDSVWKWQKLVPHSVGSFSRMLMDHPVLGATTLANRCAVEKAFPLPNNSIDHDWWLGLVSSAFGILKIIPEKTMLYRRHDQNTSALPLTSNPLMALKQIAKWSVRLDRIIDYTILQASEFKERFKNDLSENQKTALFTLINLRRVTWMTRKMMIIKHRLWFTSALKNAVYLILI